MERTTMTVDQFRSICRVCLNDNVVWFNVHDILIFEKVFGDVISKYSFIRVSTTNYNILYVEFL